MTEEWRAVVGYEGLYEVSNFGRVRSLSRLVPYKGGPSLAKRGGKILTQKRDKDGYMIASLSSCGRGSVHRVHRLVASAFIENPDALPQVNHIDGRKDNNKISNLEWCSSQHNIQHKYRLGYTQKDARVGKRVTVEGGREFVSIKSAARALGLTPMAVKYRAASPNFSLNIKQ